MTTTIANYRSYRLTEDNFNKYKALLRAGTSSWKLSQDHQVPISTANRIYKAADFTEYNKLLVEARNRRYANAAAERHRNAHPVEVKARTESPFADQSKRTYTEVITDTIVPDINIDGKPANAPTDKQIAARNALRSWAEGLHSANKKGEPIVINPAQGKGESKNTVGLRYIKKDVACNEAIMPGTRDPRLTDDCPYMPYWPLPINAGLPLHLYADGSEVKKRYTRQEMESVIKSLRRGGQGSVTRVLREHKMCTKQIFRQILFITNPDWLEEFDRALEETGCTPRRTYQNAMSYVMNANKTSKAVRKPERTAGRRNRVQAIMELKQDPEDAQKKGQEPVEMPITKETTAAEIAEAGVEKATITMQVNTKALERKPRQRTLWPLRVNWALIGVQLMALVEQMSGTIAEPWYTLLTPVWFIVGYQFIWWTVLALRVVSWAKQGKDVNYELYMRGVIKGGDNVS